MLGWGGYVALLINHYIYRNNTELYVEFSVRVPLILFIFMRIFWTRITINQKEYCWVVEVVLNFY